MRKRESQRETIVINVPKTLQDDGSWGSIFLVLCVCLPRAYVADVAGAAGDL